MSDDTATVSRRGFLRTAGGATAAAAATGSAAAQEEGGGGGTPDYGGWFGNVGNFGGETVDATGQSEVTISVGASGNGGNLAFDPPAVHVDAGTTVIWEWTGQGGTHNVVADDGSYESGTAVAEEGTTFENTFEEDGISKYVCSPHEGLGMKGAVVVGTDFPTSSGGDGGGGGGGGGGGPSLPSSAQALGVATTFVMAATLGLAYVFMKYGGDYETE